MANKHEKVEELISLDRAIEIKKYLNPVEVDPSTAEFSWNGKNVRIKISPMWVHERLWTGVAIGDGERINSRDGVMYVEKMGNVVDSAWEVAYRSIVRNLFK